MKIRSTNPLVRYFNFIFEYYPIDFCTLFWGSLYAIMFFWLEIPGKWYARLTESRRIFWDGVYFYSSLYLLFQFVSGIIWLFGIDWFNVDWIWLLKVLGIAIAVLIIGLIIILIVVYLVLFVKDKIQENIVPNDQPSSISIWWATIRGKYCTKIEYV